MNECEIGTVNPLEGQFDKKSCIECGIGSISNTEAVSCILCKVGKYNDEKKQEKCKKCQVHTSLSPCSVLPGTTTEDIFKESLVFSTKDIMTAIDPSATIPAPQEMETKVVTVTTTTKEESEAMESMTIAVYVLLGIASILVLSVHRLFCAGCTEADVMFARSDLLDPGRAVRDIPSKLGKVYNNAIFIYSIFIFLFF